MTIDQIIAQIAAKGVEQAKLLAADQAKEVTVTVSFADRHGDLLKATVTGIAPFTVERVVGGLTGAEGLGVLGQPYTGLYGRRQTRYTTVTRNGESLFKFPLLNDAEAAELAEVLNLRAKIAADNAAIAFMSAKIVRIHADTAEMQAEMFGVPALQAAE